jgi:hypothetical protein
MFSWNMHFVAIEGLSVKNLDQASKFTQGKEVVEHLMNT